MGTKNWEEVDISGDVGLRVWGNSLAGVFRNAAEGMYSLVADTSLVETAREISVIARGESREGLLVAFLNELIYHFDTHGFIGKEIKIKEITERSVSAMIRGEENGQMSGNGHLLLKAATYHNISIQESQGKWTAFVMFDI